MLLPYAVIKYYVVVEIYAETRRRQQYKGMRCAIRREQRRQQRARVARCARHVHAMLAAAA